MHKDEKTPRLHALIIPMKDGKLNARHYVNGRGKMKSLQNTYYESVKMIGLERGIKGSKAKHQDLKHYYSTIKAEQKELYRKAYGFTKRRIRKPSREDIKRAIMWAEEKEKKIEQNDSRGRGCENISITELENFLHFVIFFNENIFYFSFFVKRYL